MTPTLDRECDVFCRAIAGIGAPDAIRRDYARAHEVGPLRGGAVSFFDRALVRIASSGWLLTRLADSYAAIFARRSLLRRKLVMLLAILESHGRTARFVDAPRMGSLGGFVLAAALRTAVFVACVLLAAVVLAPIQLASLVAGEAR